MRSINRNGLLSVVSVLAAAGIAVFGWVDRARFAPAEDRTSAPDFSAPSLHGDTVSLSDFGGRVVLLNVWATWCRPCVSELPSLQRLQDRFADQGLEVLTVAVDDDPVNLEVMGGAAAQVRSFAHDLGLRLDILLENSGHIESLYAVYGLPTTFLIDRKGLVRQKIVGARNWDDPEFAGLIERLLRG